MNTVEPIRNRADVDEMKDFLYDQAEKYGLLFSLGINTGLRISDLLALKVADVWCGSALLEIRIREQKTGKERTCRLNSTARLALEAYLGDFVHLDPEYYLFVSHTGKPLDRVQVWRVLNHAAEMCGVPGPIGTHTLRKTFGYHAHQAGVPVELLQKVFGHSTASITLRYIGITADQVADVYGQVEL